MVGPSGCGNSTILNMIGGLVAPSAGTVELDGRPVAGVSRAPPPGSSSAGTTGSPASSSPTSSRSPRSRASRWCRSSR
ncbi:MAG: ATP-binding cassette domain-containing protein [Candidatus Rokubacteria bacterium]|nr:ATP-binding cassette domain-containing protein [Candidatus Rokubacteria bacterium]